MIAADRFFPAYHFPYDLVLEVHFYLGQNMSDDNDGKSVRVMLLDDHALIRHGLASYLRQQPGFQIVGECATSRELLAALGRGPADLLLIDYSLGIDSADGLHLIRMLRVRHPTAKILVISAHNNPITAAMALSAGAGGFMGKSQDLDELLGAIHAVMEGRVYVARDLLDASSALYKLTAPELTCEDEITDLIRRAPLTPREREVLRCCLEGLSVSKIAEKFNRSLKTVSGQKQSAFRKLGISTDNELFRISRIL
jgi:two-component system capsular synthesis response regulator RcsB